MTPQQQWAMLQPTEEERCMSQHPTAASLRWRARLAKTAATYNSLESISVLDDAKKEESEERSSNRQNVGRYSSSLNPVDGMAALAVGASLLTLQSAPLEILSTTASLLTAGLGPYLSYQDRRIRKGGTIRRMQNELRYDVNVLQMQNQQLKKTLSRLENQVEELEETEMELRQLCNHDSTILRRLVTLVEQQGQVFSQMQQVLLNKVIQIILRVVLESNRGDGKLSAQQVEVLLIRLQHVPGIQVNESRFRTMLAADHSLTTLLKIILGMIMNTKAADENEDWVVRAEPMSLLTISDTKNPQPIPPQP